MEVRRFMNIAQPDNWGLEIVVRDEEGGFTRVRHVHLVGIDMSEG